MAASAIMIPQQQQPQQQTNTTTIQHPPLPKGPPTNENIQDMIRRKREMDASKRRQHLTEADCNILLTNANEFSFADGQVIGHEGDILNAAYRVKSGAVSLMKNGHKMCEVTQGWFIGETVFLSAKFAELGVDLVANGPVVLAEINVPFVQKLFEVDRTLALKFYRHIAQKLSVIYLNMIRPPQRLSHRAMSVSSMDSISSSSSSSESLPSPFPIRSPSMDSGIAEFNTPRRKLTKRQSFHFSRAPFKAYPLASSRGVAKSVLLKARKLVILTESLGLKFKNKIPFVQITNFVRTSEDSVTVVADTNKAKTLFFKNINDLEEFYGVLQSLIARVAQPSSKSIVTAPISSPKPLVPAEEEDIMHSADKEMLTRIGVRRQYKKGDVVVEEGDLFQRVYMINHGTMSAMLGDHEVNPLKTGDSFGVITMFHLRPFPTNVVVTSETAEVVVVPAFKIMELIAQDNDLAVRIYRKAAIVVSMQIEKLIQVNKEKGILY